MSYKYFKGMRDVEREQDGEGRGMSAREGEGKDVKGKGCVEGKGDVEVRGVLKGRGGC